MLQKAKTIMNIFAWARSVPEFCSLPASDGFLQALLFGTQSRLEYHCPN